MLKQHTKQKLPKTLPHTIHDATNVFAAWIDPDFKNYGFTSDSSAKATTLTVYDLKENGTFQQIFDSLKVPLDSLVMTQGQVIEFAKTLKEVDPYDYFFLLKNKEGKFFVAYVYVRGDGRLEVYVRQLSYDCVWYAERRHRFVVPQLTPLKSSPDTLTLVLKNLETLEKIISDTRGLIGTIK